MIEIKQHKINNCEITVPGSKSFTHRMLIAAALSEGVSLINNGLISEDTQMTIAALEQMGIRIEVKTDGFLVHGRGGHLNSCDSPIHLENSGTSMRLLTAVAAIGKGIFTLTGSKRMGERPIQDLLDALGQLGVSVRSLNNNGCPPVEVTGGTLSGDKVTINCEKSSQYLSALLLIAPYTENGIEITVIKGPVSRPYVDMTVEVMKTFGVTLTREGYRKFKVPGAQVYRTGEYWVEGDCSQAAYFWSAAAITGTRIKVLGIKPGSPQGDVRFVDLLNKMGCRIFKEPDGISVLGGALSAIKADLSDMPDSVPTLALVAAFAEGTSEIYNVAHLKSKESDRLTAVVTELNKMGIKATATDSALVVKGGKPCGSIIDTYNDHRIAMSFAIAGLNVPGVYIRDESCVEKSFPDFWQVFEGLYG